MERYTRVVTHFAAPVLHRIKDAKRTKSLSLTVDNKIRIGFISQHFSNHSNLLAFEGVIRYLDRAKFRVVLIHLDGVRKDTEHLSISSTCDEVIYLTNDLAQSYYILHGLGLDILFFTDLGMTPYDFFYPMFRSAPIQLTGWGVPHTSGMKDIDYYISAKDIEPEDSESQYTEKLVMLPGGLPCCFLADINEIPNMPREYFFLPTDATLIGCLQTLHKLHPDFDILLEDIAN